MTPSPSASGYLPTTMAQARRLGWRALDVILVTGDAYIDSPFIGAAVIARVLVAEGFRVGIIAQPDIASGKDITRLGEPLLFWGVTGGSVDSLVANTTALLRRRRHDDLTPGGLNTRRPDRAAIVYSHLIRRHFKATRPIVLGGIEASLRRISHYDYWSDRIRRAILCDAKADILVFGMGERTVVQLARALHEGRDWRELPGVGYLSAEPPGDCLRLPDHELVARDEYAFEEMFRLFAAHCEPLGGRRLCQRQDARFMVLNPPAAPLATAELDAVHALPFQRALHPSYRHLGEVRALETIRFSLVSHRGCYGECRFCAIAMHQGRTVTSRSYDALLTEAGLMSHDPAFRGTIRDVGGPTANMYGFECRRKLRRGACADRSCLWPQVCSQLRVDHGPQLKLLEGLRRLVGVRHVFVASGVRHDLVLADREHGEAYLKAMIAHHISGQIKLAPEHTCAALLRLMGKPPFEALLAFRERFHRLCRQMRCERFLTYYLMAAHPGCDLDRMRRMRERIRHDLRLSPEQVQIFTPTPSTWSSLMYVTGRDPFSGQRLFVERALGAKAEQKRMLVGRPRLTLASRNRRP
jgi:uncharacterized radical SAM protein YgiQ